MSRAFRPLVLCYHRVSSSPPHRLAVSAETLGAHLGLLMRRGYVPGRVEDVLAGRSRVFHVTFDDAFRSVQNALPVLERASTPATVFVCSAFADTGTVAIPSLDDDVARAPGEFATLTWDELRELDLDVGSHAVSHPYLTRLGDDELRRELDESRERIEDELRRPCRWLAYPYGDHDARVRAAAEQAGYRAAFAVAGPRAPVDPFALPRVDLYFRDVGLRAALKLSPLFRWGAGARR